MAALTERGLAGEPLNIACGERISLNALLGQMQGILGTAMEAEYLPARAGDVRDSLADIGAAKGLIGYEPEVMFAEGLRRTVEGYRGG